MSKDCKIKTDGQQLEKEYILSKEKSGESKIVKENSDEFKLLTDQPSYSKTVDQLTKNKLKKQRDADIAFIKQEIDLCQKKLDDIITPKIKKKGEKELALLEQFFKEHIVIKKGSNVITTDVMTKVNELFFDKNIRFNKFEVSRFMKGKTISKRKSGNHNYYVNIKLI